MYAAARFQYSDLGSCRAYDPRSDASHGPAVTRIWTPPAKVPAEGHGLRRIPAVAARPLGPFSLCGSNSRPLFGRQAFDLKAPDGRGVGSVLPRRLGVPWDRPEAAFLGALPVPRVC